MRERIRIGTTDDGTHTPIWFDGELVWYGCGMIPLDEDV